MSKKTKSYYESLIGKKYGHLTINEMLGYDKRRMMMVKCTCDCGQTTVKFLKYLKNGDTTACSPYCEYSNSYAHKCACEGTNRIRKKSNNNTVPWNKIVFSETDKALYSKWKSMKKRCSHPELKGNESYKNIEVCKEWKNDFISFRDWAINNGFYFQPKEVQLKDRLSIDRIDPKGNYCPENCRFITVSENTTRANINRYHGDTEIS